jgi:hypothetical protein
MNRIAKTFAAAVAVLLLGAVAEAPMSEALAQTGARQAQKKARLAPRAVAAGQSAPMAATTTSRPVPVHDRTTGGCGGGGGA